MHTGKEPVSLDWRADVIPIIADGVSSHLFEDQLLIFSEPYQKLYALNNSAAFIWSGCENRLSWDELVASLISTYGIESDQARADVNTALAKWATAGLLRSDEAGWQDPAAEESNADIGLDSPVVHTPDELVTPAFFRLALLGNEILLRYASCDLKPRISEVFDHLESTSSGPARTVDIVESEDRFHIYAPGVPAVNGIDSPYLISALTQTVLQSAYRSCNFLIAVHAAVLSVGQKCVILSGHSGTGKSTLAAGLIKNGFTYFTDEVALVDRVTRNVIPAPVSLRIKEGGWDIVGAMFPDLHRATSHVQPDGSKLRYLPPPAGSFVKDVSDSCPAGWLVFPRYSPEEETSLAPISRIDAIARLQSNGYDMGGLLDRRKITELLSWLKTVDCFEMKVNRLDESVAIIRSLVRERATA